MALDSAVDLSVGLAEDLAVDLAVDSAGDLAKDSAMDFVVVGEAGAGSGGQHCTHLSATLQQLLLIDITSRAS